jgi:hypothetical protein
VTAVALSQTCDARGSSAAVGGIETASKGQLTGMRGVYLVAAELSRLGFIASPTSRSAIGADILVTDQECKNSYSVQVKTDTTGSNFWLLGKKSKEMVSETHIYVFVKIRRKKEIEDVLYFIVPSKVIAKNMDAPDGDFPNIKRDKITKYQNNWSPFGKA